MANNGEGILIVVYSIGQGNHTIHPQDIIQLLIFSLYMSNISITQEEVRYGRILAFDLFVGNHSRADMQPYDTATHLYNSSTA